MVVLTMWSLAILATTVTCLVIIPAESRDRRSGLVYHRLQAQASEPISRDVQGDQSGLNHLYVGANSKQFGDRIYSVEQNHGDADSEQVRDKNEDNSEKNEEYNEEQSDERASQQNDDDRSEVERVNEDKENIEDGRDHFSDDKDNEELNEDVDNDEKYNKGYKFEEFKWPSTDKWYDNFFKSFDDYGGYGKHGKFGEIRQYGGHGRFGCLELGYGEYCGDMS